MVSLPAIPLPPDTSTDDIAERGFRIVEVTQADGTIAQTWVPLTSEEFLHPKEGYHLPNSTFHDDIAGTVKELLTRRYANDETVGVFRDLLIKWDIAGLKDNCPDTFVAFGIRNKSGNRTEFWVEEERTRPAFVLEVVSPKYRKEDREIKVMQYAQAQVQEYVIIDRRKQRRQVIDEILGYRLVAGHYQPISPDDDGRILCQTLGLWMSFQEGCVVLEDVQTGERLQTAVELEAANQELTASNQELSARLALYQQRFGELPES
jgi:Uma2 family endonuclease